MLQELFTNCSKHLILFSLAFYLDMMVLPIESCTTAFDNFTANIQSSAWKEQTSLAVFGVGVKLIKITNATVALNITRIRVCLNCGEQKIFSTMEEFVHLITFQRINESTIVSTFCCERHLLRFKRQLSISCCCCR